MAPLPVVKLVSPPTVPCHHWDLHQPFGLGHQAEEEDAASVGYLGTANDGNAGGGLCPDISQQVAPNPFQYGHCL